MDKDLNWNQELGMNDTPLISIMMLTFNRAKYIAAAIESVLDQNFENWELLIIDGGSRDNTEAVVNKYLNDKRIKYIRPATNLGLTGNRNLALQMAEGEYIAVLDSDDVWIDDTKLQKQYAFLKENKEYVLVGTNFERIDESGRTLDKMSLALTDAEIRNNLLSRNEFAHSSVMYRKDPALRAGSYDSSLFIWEDLDLWLRLGFLGKLANLPAYTTAYRKHSGSISGSRRVKGALTIIKIIKKYRKNYPHFLGAYFKAWARVLIRAIGL